MAKVPQFYHSNETPDLLHAAINFLGFKKETSGIFVFFFLHWPLVGVKGCYVQNDGNGWTVMYLLHCKHDRQMRQLSVRNVPWHLLRLLSAQEVVLQNTWSQQQRGSVEKDTCRVLQPQPLCPRVWYLKVKYLNHQPKWMQTRKTSTVV